MILDINIALHHERPIWLPKPPLCIFGEKLKKICILTNSWWFSDETTTYDPVTSIIPWMIWCAWILLSTLIGVWGVLFQRHDEYSFFVFVVIERSGSTPLLNKRLYVNKCTRCSFWYQCFTRDCIKNATTSLNWRHLYFVRAFTIYLGKSFIRTLLKIGWSIPTKDQEIVGTWVSSQSPDWRCRILPHRRWFLHLEILSTNSIANFVPYLGV